jgi:hypothetical protein
MTTVRSDLTSSEREELNRVWTEAERVTRGEPDDRVEQVRRSVFRALAKRLRPLNGRPFVDTDIDQYFRELDKAAHVARAMTFVQR